MVNSANPTALSDAVSNGYLNVFIIQRTERRAYAVTASNFSLVPSLQTDLEARNTQPNAASAWDGNLYVADLGGYIYEYSGVPQRQVGGNAGGSSFNMFQMFMLNEMMGKEFTYDNRP